MCFINKALSISARLLILCIFFALSPLLKENEAFSHQQVLSKKELSELKININDNIVKDYPWLRKFNKIVSKYSNLYDIDKNLIFAVIQSESSGRPQVVSPAGAIGLMQLMPDTASLMKVENIFNVEDNVHGGIKYLSHLKKLYRGNVKKMLWAYNAGPGKVKRNVMPEETENYIKNVLKLYKYFTS